MHTFIVLLSLSVLLSPCCCRSLALPNNNKLQNQSNHRLLPEDSPEGDIDQQQQQTVPDEPIKTTDQDEDITILINDQDMYRSEDENETSSSIWIQEAALEADAAQYGTMEDELLQNMEEDVVDVASDADETEETDVQEAAQELVEEAESEASSLATSEDDEQQPASEAVAGESNKEEAPTTNNTVTSSNSYYNDDPNNTKRSAWVAHGTIGAIVFGLIVPMTISSAFFRDLIPTYWIYIHVCMNVITFVMTFFTVGIAFTTMNGSLLAGDGHFQEVHHICGLLLLLIVSFQTANGFLRPPREFITDDEYDKTPGAILRSTMNHKSMTARTLWYLVHSLSGLLVFVLGAYQVQSGLGLFAKRFGSPDWSSVYTGYIIWLGAVIVIAKVWMIWKERRMTKNTLEFQMGRGSNVGYDPENDFTVAQFETV